MRKPIVFTARWSSPSLRRAVTAGQLLALLFAGLVFVPWTPLVTWSEARSSARLTPLDLQATPVTTPTSPLLADVPPELLPDAEQAMNDLSVVQIRATLNPTLSTIGGEMEVFWRNPIAEPLDDVWFRLFPNASYYGAGDITVTGVIVDGVPVTPVLAMDDTALRVPLPATVFAGERATIALQFFATVPVDSTGS